MEAPGTVPIADTPGTARRLPVHARNSYGEPATELFLALLVHLREKYAESELEDAWIPPLATIHEAVLTAGDPERSADYIVTLEDEYRTPYVEYLYDELPDDIRDSYRERLFAAWEFRRRVGVDLTGYPIEYSFNDDHTIKLDMFPGLREEADPEDWALIEALSIAYAAALSRDYDDELDSVLQLVRHVQQRLGAVAWRGPLAREAEHANEVLAHVGVELEKLLAGIDSDTDGSSSSDDDGENERV